MKIAVLFLLALPLVLSASIVPVAPEIDPGSIMTGSALLFSVVLMRRGRKKR